MFVVPRRVENFCDKSRLLLLPAIWEAIYISVAIFDVNKAKIFPNILLVYSQLGAGLTKKRREKFLIVLGFPI